MAQIDLNTFEKIEKDHNTIHSKVYSTYTVFENSGKKYVQIDTYGKSDRKMPGKLSQSLQLDISSAKFLVDLLQNEFGLK